jgi:orotate phosphoribosyltransferase
MTDFRQEFLAFALARDVLRFGEFITKAGRRTPYFFNAGQFNDGESLRALGRFYADAWLASGVEATQLYGPAYKGIPLAAATAIALAERGRNLPYSFNRKEAKDHGEGGTLVGHTPRGGDRVVIIEDVTTAGTSVRQSVPRLRAAADVRLAGLVVSVDRMERGTGEQSALSELAETFAMPCFAIVTVRELMADLRGREVDGRVVLDEATHARMLDYLAEHGGR